MNRHIFLLIKSLDYGYSRKKNFIDISKTTASVSFCSLLLSEGFISFFVLDSCEGLEPQNMRIFLCNSSLHFDDYATFLQESSLCLKIPLSLDSTNFKPYTSIIIHSRPSSVHSVSLGFIRENLNLYSISIVSTDKGFLTFQTAARLKISGQLICTFFL